MLSDFTATANAIAATTKKSEKERILADYLRRSRRRLARARGRVLLRLAVPAARRARGRRRRRGDRRGGGGSERAHASRRCGRRGRSTPIRATRSRSRFPTIPSRDITLVGAGRVLRPHRRDAGRDREEGRARGAVPQGRRAGRAVRREDPHARAAHRTRGRARGVVDREGVRAEARRGAAGEHVHRRHRRDRAAREVGRADDREDGALPSVRVHARAAGGGSRRRSSRRSARTRSRTTSTTASARRFTPTAPRCGSTRARSTTSRIASRRSRRRRARSGRSVILDGEIVAFRDRILPFAIIQKRLGRRQVEREAAERRAGGVLRVRSAVSRRGGVVRGAAAGADWRSCAPPWCTRRSPSRHARDDSPIVRDAAHVDELFDAARARANEGLVVKDPELDLHAGPPRQVVAEVQEGAGDARLRRHVRAVGQRQAPRACSPTSRSPCCATASW